MATVIANLDDEIVELKQAMDSDDSQAIADELGDVLFSAVNVARHLGFDAEKLLRQSNMKFERRFVAMEKQAYQEGKDLASESNEQLEKRWIEVKSTKGRL